MFGQKYFQSRQLMFFWGFIVGMSVVEARAFFVEARTDLEPTVGRLAAIAAGGVAYIAWIAFIAFFTGWLLRLLGADAIFKVRETQVKP